MAVKDKILRKKGNSIFQPLGKTTINENEKSSAKSNEYRNGVQRTTSKFPYRVRWDEYRKRKIFRDYVKENLIQYSVIPPKLVLDQTTVPRA